MSLKLFVYYCALCGGWAGFFSWAFANAVFWVGSDVAKQALIGAILGFFLAAAIGGVDALLNDNSA